MPSTMPCFLEGYLPAFFSVMLQAIVAMKMPVLGLSAADAIVLELYYSVASA